MGGQPDRLDTHTCPGGVLKLGLNFAPAPSKLPLTDTNDLRGHVCGILRRVMVPRSKLDEGPEDSDEGAKGTACRK